MADGQAGVMRRATAPEMRRITGRGIRPVNVVASELRRARPRDVVTHDRTLGDEIADLHFVLTDGILRPRES